VVLFLYLNQKSVQILRDQLVVLFLYLNQKSVQILQKRADCIIIVVAIFKLKQNLFFPD